MPPIISIIYWQQLQYLAWDKSAWLVLNKWDASAMMKKDAVGRMGAIPTLDKLSNKMTHFSLYFLTQ